MKPPSEASISPIFQLLNLIYPVLLMISIFILFVESVSYHGFIHNRLQLNTDAIILITTISAFIVYEKKRFLNRDRLAIFVFGLCVVTGLILTFLQFSEKQHFSNYVYSSYHINLKTLPSLFVFLLLNFVGMWFFGLIHLEELSKKIADSLHGISLQKGYILVGVLVFSLLLYQLQVVFTQIGKGTASLISLSQISRHDRITEAYGGKNGAGFINIYGDFVNRNTPEDAVIFIPPQIESWQMEGNEAFFRYFIYPRKIVQSTDLNSPIPDTATHVLIAHGLFVNNPETQTVWPRISIDQTKIDHIMYIDRKTLEESTATNSAYAPSFDKEQWGLITLKK